MINDIQNLRQQNQLPKLVMFNKNYSSHLWRFNCLHFIESRFYSSHCTFHTLWRLKSTFTTRRDSVPVSQRLPTFNRRCLQQSVTRNVNTPCGQNSELFNAKPGAPHNKNKRDWINHRCRSLCGNWCPLSSRTRGTVGCRRYGTEVVWAGAFRTLMGMFYYYYYYYYYYLLKFTRWQ